MGLARWIEGTEDTGLAEETYSLPSKDEGSGASDMVDDCANVEWVAIGVNVGFMDSRESPKLDWRRLRMQEGECGGLRNTAALRGCLS